MVIALFLTFPVLSQQRQRLPAIERAKQESEMLKKELNLTQTQTPKVDSIILFFAKKMDEIVSSGDRERMRSAFQTNEEEKGKALQPILSDAQYKKYKDLVEQQRQNRPGGGRNPNR